MFKHVALCVVVALLSLQWVQAQDKPAESKPKAQPVDYRKLKEWMPAELAGVKRSSSEGEKISLGEMVFTQASADYRKQDAGENDPSVHVQVMDYAGAADMGEAMSAWQTIDIDRESDNRYERTTRIKDQPAYEQYRNDSKSGQIQVWVGGRFYVNVSTTNVPADDVKKLAETLPIDKLMALK